MKKELVFDKKVDVSVTLLPNKPTATVAGCV